MIDPANPSYRADAGAAAPVPYRDQAPPLPSRPRRRRPRRPPFPGPEEVPLGLFGPLLDEYGIQRPRTIGGEARPGLVHALLAELSRRMFGGGDPLTEPAADADSSRTAPVSNDVLPGQNTGAGRQADIESATDTTEREQHHDR